MLSYLIRRLLLMVPTLLGISAVVFFTMALAPGNVAEMLISAEGEMKAGDRAARMKYIEQRYGLDQPIVVQYGRWLNRISPVGVWSDAAEAPSGFGLAIGSSEQDGQTKVRRVGFKAPDLGESFVKGRPVLALIGEALPVTLTLNLITLPLVYGISIISGVYAGRFRGKRFDVWGGLFLLALWSAPVLWIGVVLQGFLANEHYLWWFPTSGLHALDAPSMRFLPSWSDTGQFQIGYLLDWMWHLALPVICLSYGSFAFLSKLTRGAMLENLSADFVRTARAKGLSERVVLWHHAFRNSLLPLITVAAYIIPGLLGGSVIVEFIFGIPGMGRLMIQAIEFKDQELVMAVTLVTGVLAMGAYLIADVCYAMVDPRVSYE